MLRVVRLTPLKGSAEWFCDPGSCWVLGLLTLKKNMAYDFSDVPLPSGMPFKYRQCVPSEDWEDFFFGEGECSLVVWSGEVGGALWRGGRSYIQWVGTSG